MLVQIDWGFLSAGSVLHWNINTQFLCLKSFFFFIWIYEIVWHRQRILKMYMSPYSGLKTGQWQLFKHTQTGFRCGLVTGLLFNSPAEQVGKWPGGNSIRAQLCFSLGTALLEYASCATNLLSFLPMCSSTFFLISHVIIRKILEHYPRIFHLHSNINIWIPSAPEILLFALL